MSATPFSAALLRASLDGFAGLAASRLLEVDPSSATLDGLSGWKTFQREQLAGLVAALDTGSPAGFAARSAWSRDAFAARGTPRDVLLSALDALSDVLEDALPGEAWSVLIPYFAAARQELRSAARALTSALDPADVRGRVVLRYVDALRACDEPLALAVVLDEVASGRVHAREALMELLVPAQREIGRLWHRGEIGVAQEHFASNVTRRVVERVLAIAPRAAPRGKPVVVAAVAGDAHDLGVLVVAGCFELAGWRTLFLGSNVPAVDLTQIAVQCDAGIVALGATIDTQREAAAAAIVALRAARPGQKVIVGGPAFSCCDDAWKRIGADAMARDAREAVEIGERLRGASSG